MSHNPVRSQLQEALKVKKLTPTQEVSRLSPLLFDRSLTKNKELSLSKIFASTIDGERKVRVKVPRHESLKLEIEFNLSVARSFEIKDDKNRILFSCQVCLGKKSFFAKDTQILKISLHDESGFKVEESVKLRAVTDTEPLGTHSKRLDIVMDGIELQQLKTLTLAAKSIASNHRYTFPKQKIGGQIHFQGKVSKAKIGLSGRTEVHFEFFPSVGVSISSGPYVWGSQKFKLYRIMTKEGLIDFVGSSVLRDLGVFVPQQKLIRLYVNSQYQGLYIFEENFSAPLFENQQVVSGKIFGFDTGLFFQQYPNVRLRTKVLYDPSRGGRGKAVTDVRLESQGFANRVDVQSMSKLIAFSSILFGFHGLGADDLRFYENPLTGRFYPIARDMGLLSWHPGEMNSLVHNIPSQFPLWYLSRTMAFAPSVPITAFAGDEVEFKTYAAAWDIHPAALNFMKIPSNRLSAQQMLLEFANKGVSRTFFQRMQNVLAQLEGFPEESHRDVQTLKRHFRTHSKQYRRWEVDKLVQRAFGTAKLSLQETGNEFYLSNDFGMAIEIPAEKMRGKLQVECGATNKQGNPVIGPMWNHFPSSNASNISPKQMAAIYSRERELNKLSPVCTIKALRATSTTQIGQLLEQAMKGGMEKVEVVEYKPKAKVSANDGNGASDRQGVFLPHNVLETDSHLMVRYISAKVKKDSKQPVFENIRFLNENGQPVPYQLRHFSIENAEASDSALNTKRVLEYLNSPKHLYLGGATFVEFQFKRASKLQYLHLDKRSVHKAFGSTQRLYFVSPPEFVVPVHDIKQSQDVVLTPESLGIALLKEGSSRRHYSINSSLEIHSPLLIQRHEILTIAPGVELRFGSSGSLKVEGELNILGTAKRPVTLKPTGKDWGGITIIESPGLNRFEHVHISNARSFEDSTMKTFGGINVLFSEAVFRNAKLLNFLSEDAINVHHGRLQFSQSQLLGSQDDGIDSDFSSGRIDRSVFEKMGGDAIDLNQSDFEIVENQIEGNGDKGISVGEKSMAKIRGNLVAENRQGITIKDSSSAELSNNRIVKKSNGVGLVCEKALVQPTNVCQQGESFHTQRHG